MELIDTHCHLTFEQLAPDIDAVLQRSRAAGVTSWITIGTDKNENNKALALAEKYDNLYAAVAIHPHEAKTVLADDLKELRQIAKNPKVVAIGETGLDYHYDFSPAADQMRLFANLLQIAAELSLPVIIHSRKAFGDTVDFLDRYAMNIKKIVLHCFSYSAQEAKILLGKGFYFSFTGSVTFKNAETIRQAAKIIPLEKLMIETDCPYMSPEPMRKQKVNEPALLVHTARFLSDLKHIPLDEFAKTVTRTSRIFFSLPHPNARQ
jgi:TatD DNase family protein